MATTFTVRITDQLLRFDTTADDAIVTLLPFAQTPNAPFEIHKTSFGDGHTVTVQADPQTSDFLLPDGSTSVTLDDANPWVRIKIPADGASPAYVSVAGTGGGSGGGGAVNTPAPPVTIAGPAEILFRDNGKVEVDVPWMPAAGATAANFQGVAVYLEDPDISSGNNIPLDGTALLDGSRQASGQWAPTLAGNSLPPTTGAGGTAVLLLDAVTAGAPAIRNVRIYLAAYGPYSQPKLVRANAATPTPNIMVEIAQGPSSYQSGMEWARICTNPKVSITTDFNRPDPNYYLTYTYTPPDSTVPLPSGVNQFGGCRIVNVQLDSNGNPIFPGSDTGVSVPVAQSANGYKSPVYDAAAGGSKFRAYFCSEDNGQPLGSHINSLVMGVTPYVDVTVPAVAPAPDVTAFTISGQQILHLLSQAFVAQATFAWSLPIASAGGVRYAGVFLYLVKNTGSSMAAPAKLTGQQSNIDTSFILQVPNVPAAPETWTIAAISVDVNGVLSDDPSKFGQAGFHSPTVTWNIGPPVPGTPGSGTEYAPLVTLNGGATATATETMSSDGVRMVSFLVGTWTNPPANQFGGAQVAMVVNNDTTKPTFWPVPASATSYQTPPIPSFGNIGGAAVPVEFFIVSDDPQGRKNSIQPGTTPVIALPGGYVPTAGQVIPSRATVWWDPAEFQWPTGLEFGALQFAAQKIFVGSILRVGGGAGTDAASFAGQQNGQIAVFNASNQMVGWVGQQQPTQGNGAATAGAWFKALWVGGQDPTTAPLFIDNQGIIEVGGIAAANGATYPYISVRDNTGLESGRIGAMISSATDSTGNVGSNPPAISAGAWFTQLAVGGSNLSNWNVLITKDLTNPLGSNFQIRNVYKLSIDYAAQYGNPANNEYKLEFGNSVWMGGGLPAATWQFPGIHIYEVDGSGNNFGATLLNRGMVLRGTSAQTYAPIVSLVTWNGDQAGSDTPAQFFGQLTMSNPLAPSIQNVVLASGSSSSGAIAGNAYMRLGDVNNNVVLAADTTGCTAVAFSTVAHGQVIDSAGNWHGQPISGSQTPWVSDIAGAGHNLTNVASIQVNGAVSAGGGYTGGAFTGAGINMPAQGVGCNSLSVYYSGAIQAQMTVQQAVENLPSGTSVYFLNITNSGGNAALMFNGNQVIDYTGIYIGKGVQANSAIYGASFGIYGVAVGASGTFTTANGKTVTVNGGIITSIA